MKTFDYDVIIWDTVGSEISESAAKKPMGGSEYHLLQLTRALTGRGFSVRIIQGDHRLGNVLGRLGRLKCRVLIHSRYSTLIAGGGQVFTDRIVVFATDMPGAADGSPVEDGGAYRHLGGLFLGEQYPAFKCAYPTTLVCLSQWQLGLFPKVWQANANVIPMMIDDRAYGRGRIGSAEPVPKVPKRFVYASAAMKGLDATIVKWIAMRVKYRKQMVGAELHITTNWDMPPIWTRVLMTKENGIVDVGRLCPHDVEDLMATAEGLFYVNKFPETFCSIAALAEACNARAHILCLNSPGGIPEATRGPWVTTDAEVFERLFIQNLGNSTATMQTPRDCSVTTTMPLWLEALRLLAYRGTVDDVSLRTPSGPLPVDQDFVDPSGAGPNFGFYACSYPQPDGTWKGDGRMHQVRDLVSEEKPDKFESSAPPPMPVSVETKGFPLEGMTPKDGALCPRCWMGGVFKRDRCTTCEDRGYLPGSLLPPGKLWNVWTRAERLLWIDKTPAQRLAWLEEQKPKPGTPTIAGMMGSSNPQPKKSAWDAWTPAARDNWRKMSMRNRRRFAAEKPAQFEGSATAVGPAWEPGQLRPGEPTIGLVMIAKNEEAVIRRALKSVGAVVSAVTIVIDDKTTDGTENVIADWFYREAHKALRLNLITEKLPWRGGFAATRNEALDIARKRNLTDYLLLLDCDDVYEGLEKIDLRALTKDSYTVTIEESDAAFTSNYQRPVLLRSDAPFLYKGRHHEYIDHGAGPVTYGDLTKEFGVKYLRLGGGSSNTGATEEEGAAKRKEKYLREAAVFVEEIEKDPSDTRSMFYAAQSFADGGDVPNAVKWNVRRGLAEGGWYEERFVAFMRAGDLLFPFTTAIDYYLRAYELIPARRAEALCAMAKVYNERKLFMLAYRHLTMERDWDVVMRVPEGLFVKASVYTWEFTFQSALAMTYLSNEDASGFHPTVPHGLWRDLLSRVPEGQKQTIYDNMKFCKV